MKRRISPRKQAVSRMDSLEIILGDRSSHFSEHEKLELAEEKNRIYREYLQTMRPSDLSEDTRYALQTLRKRGYLLAIGSSSKNTRQILTQLGLEHFFDAVADGTQITRSKPDPEVFLLAASLLGVSPEQAVVIEDAESGVQAAKAGHFRVIGIRSKENDPNSDITIKKLSDLTKIL